MIFSPFERMVAIRYLRSRRKEGLISVIAGFSLLGIALGVATLLIVMAVMNGFHEELIGRVIGLRGHLAVYPSSTRTLDNFESLAIAAQQVEGVVVASPIIEGNAMLVASGQASGVAVRALIPDDFQRRPQLAGKLVGGSSQDFDGNNIAIGWRIARRFNLEVGDHVTLISPQGKATAFGRVLRQRDYPIGAIFNVGMYEYDSAVVFMPLAAAQKFFTLPGVVSAIEVLIQEPDQVEVSRLRLSEALANVPVTDESAVNESDSDGLDGISQRSAQPIRTSPIRYRITDWKSQNAGLASALEVERNVMFLILTLIILVAAFNIISSLIMLVKEKGRDIAVLRTMGATRGMIMRIFFLSGASVGTTGTLLGLGLGLLFCQYIEEIRQLVQSLIGFELFAAEIYYLTRLPAIVNWGEVGQLVVMALALSWGATIYPSWRAARLDPVEALRYE